MPNASDAEAEATAAGVEATGLTSQDAEPARQEPAEAAGQDPTDPEPSAPEDPAEAIAGRLVHHRTRRGLKVSELARRVGVSPSLISQIERGQSRPSVSTLFALAEALDVPVDAFFARSEPAPDELVPHVAAPGASAVAEEPHSSRLAAAITAIRERGETRGHRYLVRRDQRATIDIEGGVRWERLTPATVEGVEFLELVYGPYAQSHETLYRHPGTEMVLLLSGRMDIYVGFDKHELAPGDSIEFPSSLPHRYVNPTDGESRAVTVILHDAVGPHAEQRRG